MSWTDERLDDLSARMDAGFARVDSEIKDLRSEMQAGFKGVRTEMHDGFRDLRAEVRGDIEALRSLMFRFGGGMLLCLAGVIASSAANGL